MKVTSECPEHLHSVQWVCLLLAKTGWKVGASVRETLGLYCGHPGETGGSEGTSIARPGTSLRALPASSLPRPLGRTRRSTPRPPHAAVPRSSWPRWPRIMLCVAVQQSRNGARRGSSHPFRLLPPSYPIGFCRTLLIGDRSSMAPANRPQPTCGRVGLFAVWCSPTHRHSVPFGVSVLFMYLWATPCTDGRPSEITPAWIASHQSSTQRGRRISTSRRERTCLRPSRRTHDRASSRI